MGGSGLENRAIGDEPMRVRFLYSPQYSTGARYAPLEVVGRAGGPRLCGKQKPIKLGLFQIQLPPRNMVLLVQLVEC